ncbi:MAG: hypothetical protein ACI8RD_007744 [Bacillariaceae sp.]|jgi:hypothetical protein
MMSKITMRFILVALVLLSSLTFCQAFGSASKAKKVDIRPTLDAEKNLYIRNPNDDGVLPYDPIGSLLRQGPAPFWTRLTNGNEYEQGILKYMYNARVERGKYHRSSKFYCSCVQSTFHYLLNSLNNFILLYYL